MSGRRGNNGRGNSRVVSNKASLGMLKSSLHGHANDLKMPSPPSFTRIPYNNIIVESILSPASSEGVGAADEGSVHVKDIIVALKEQINIPLAEPPAPEPVTIMIKITRIDLWSSTGSTALLPPSIRGKFYGLTQFVNLFASSTAVIVNPIKSLENVGLQGSDSAVVSYTFPRDQADVPLSDVGVSIPVVTWKRSNNNQTVIARYHIFWSTADNSETVFSNGLVTRPNTPHSD